MAERHAEEEEADFYFSIKRNQPGHAVVVERSSKADSEAQNPDLPVHPGMEGKHVAVVVDCRVERYPDAKEIGYANGEGSVEMDAEGSAGLHPTGGVDGTKTKERYVSTEAEGPFPFLQIHILIARTGKNRISGAFKLAADLDGYTHVYFKDLDDGKRAIQREIKRLRNSRMRVDVKNTAGLEFDDFKEIGLNADGRIQLESAFINEDM